MNREFKIALGLLGFLLALGAVLLRVLAHIPVFSRDFLNGFLPFALLLAPYILFSTDDCIRALREWTSPSLIRKTALPLYLLLVYVLSSSLNSVFDWALFYKLLAWLLFSAFILSAGPPAGSGFYAREMLVALTLWLPIEFGKLSGFDIIFREDIQIPALAFAAPVFGLYLYSVLAQVPDIGYHFRWRLEDIGRAAVGLALLAVFLIPAGTYLGFIRFSFFDTSLADMVKLLFGIYFLVALPEELLFRGIIQNLLSKILSRFPHSFPISLVLASVIFGFSHYNNFNPPDWRYVFLASVAGAVYGWVYVSTGKTTVSALVHCGVNFFWAILFKDSAG